VLNEISARAARYDRFDPEMAASLRKLRQDTRDVFNKGLDPGDDIMEQLWFLDPKTRDFVEKMSKNYSKVVTPDDFKAIAKIMSEELAEQVPILKDFTKFFGRLAEDFLINAKPSKSAFDMKSIFKIAALGKKSKGIKFSKTVAKLLGLSPNQTHSLDAIERLPFWKKDGALSELVFGKSVPNQRRTGIKVLKKKLLGKTITDGFEIFYANKMPKSWTNAPWVNFDGKIIEQNFTQTFEERLLYKDKNGNWMTNIVQVPQKTEASWWDQVTGEEGKINDIADATKARTAFAVNGNHSNDAVIVKKFHLWGAKNDIATSTIHDAFFTNAARMLEARKALRGIYAEVLEKNVILMTLDEMLDRGLPKHIYDAYLEEAISKGLVPIAGKSTVGGKVMREEDILKVLDVLEEIPEGFESNRSWYGVG